MSNSPVLRGRPFKAAMGGRKYSPCCVAAGGTHQTPDNSESIIINKAFRVRINFSPVILIDTEPANFLKW
jgi:hypothetical protein